MLPNIMRAFKATTYSLTLETLNFLMLGREDRLPDDHVQEVVLEPDRLDSDYAFQLIENLKKIKMFSKGINVSFVNKILRNHLSML